MSWSGDGLLSLSMRRDADRRAITAENPTGERGGGGRANEGTGAHAARDLGVGWKISPAWSYRQAVRSSWPRSLAPA